MIQTQPYFLGVNSILAILTGMILQYPPIPQLKVYVNNF